MPGTYSRGGLGGLGPISQTTIKTTAATTKAMMMVYRGSIDMCPRNTMPGLNQSGAVAVYLNWRPMGAKP
jgi:hypothetical protein